MTEHTSYCKSYYEKNKERELARKRKYREANKEKVREAVRAAYVKNREAYRQSDSMYKARPEIREKINSRNRKRWSTDEQFRLALQGRNSVNTSLRVNTDPNRLIVRVGCTLGELKTHLSNQFKDGMSWSNWGKWHIDHKKPLYYFDLTVPEELAKAFHWSNLQPLWAAENLAKGAQN